MLRNSCETSILKIRNKVFEILLRFGIQATVDTSSQTLQMKFRDKVGKDLSPSDLFYSVDFSTSSECFAASETVVDMIEQEYSSLFAAALFSVSLRLFSLQNFLVIFVLFVAAE